MNLTIFKDDNKNFMLMQSAWSSILNPIIATQSNNSSILENVLLTTGSNIINHKLGQTLKGWTIVRQRSAGTFYDTQDANKTPDLTLVLVSSANVSVDIMVF